MLSRRSPDPKQSHVYWGVHAKPEAYRETDRPWSMNFKFYPQVLSESLSMGHPTTKFLQKQLTTYNVVFRQSLIVKKKRCVGFLYLKILEPEYFGMELFFSRIYQKSGTQNDNFQSGLRKQEKFIHFLHLPKQSIGSP